MIMFSRRDAGPADQPRRGVSAVHPAAARVQILVLGHQGHRNRLLLYLFPSFQHPGLLAHPRHVLHHPLLHHHEEADKGDLSTKRRFLTVLSSPRLLQHMIRFRYLPFTWGKPKFQVSSHCPPHLPPTNSKPKLHLGPVSLGCPVLTDPCSPPRRRAASRCWPSRPSDLPRRRGRRPSDLPGGEACRGPRHLPPPAAGPSNCDQAVRTKVTSI